MAKKSASFEFSFEYCFREGRNPAPLGLPGLITDLEDIVSAWCRKMRSQGAAVPSVKASFRGRVPAQAQWGLGELVDEVSGVLTLVLVELARGAASATREDDRGRISITARLC